MSRLRLMLLVASVLLAEPCAADTIVQNKGMATLEVHFEPKLTLADTISATLIIDASPAHEINAPRDLPAASKWLLVERSQAERETIKPGLIRWRQTYRFAPKEPGDAPFTFPDVKLREGEAALQTIAWEPIPFTIALPTIEPDRTKMRDGIAIEKSPDPVVERSWYLLVVLCAVVTYSIVMLAVVIVVMRHSIRRKPPASASDRAIYEWRRLIAMKLPQQGRTERFITLLTMLLRAYLERDLDWPARRQTTREFLQSCTQSTSLNDLEKRFLADFLERAEAVKFAGVGMAFDECNAWAEKVRQFLEARSSRQFV